MDGLTYASKGGVMVDYIRKKGRKMKRKTWKRRSKKTKKNTVASRYYQLPYLTMGKLFSTECMVIRIREKSNQQSHDLIKAFLEAD